MLSQSVRNSALVLFMLMYMHKLVIATSGFIAVDLTVACMTEIMWMFVLLDNSLLERVFECTLKFILDPV